MNDDRTDNVLQYINIKEDDKKLSYVNLLYKNKYIIQIWDRKGSCMSSRIINSYTSALVRLQSTNTSINGSSKKI